MAIPTLTTDLTLLHAMDSLTGLSAWGPNTIGKWGVQSDIALENNLAMGLAPFTAADSGMGYHHGSNVDCTANRFYVWVKIVSASGFLTTSATTPAGVYIRLTSDTSGWTNYRDYYIGGSDVAWCNGDWHLIVLDASRTADRTNGTVTLTAIRGFGVGFNLTNTANKSDVIAVDVMRYGTKLEATGVTSSSATHSFNDNGGSDDTITRGSGSFITDGMEQGDTIRVVGTSGNDGEYTIKTIAALTLTLETGSLSGTETGVTSYVDAAITLESIFQKDGPTDDNWYGFVSKNRDGDYEINSNLLIGDESGSLRTFFLTRGETIIFADQPTASASSQLRIKVYESTGNTIFAMGNSAGTGDDRVGFGGSLVRQDTTFFATSTDGAAQAEVDLSIAIDTCEVFGSSFLKISNGVLFANDTSHYVTNTSFDTCGQVDLYATEARNVSFLNYEGTPGALLWRNGVTDVENSFFLACSRAIEHDTATTGQIYYGLQFAGNTYDVHNTTATGNVVINATKSGNGINSNPSTTLTDGTGTTTINNTKSLTITCKNSAGNALEGIRVRIENQSTGALIAEGTTNSSGIYTNATYNYSSPESVKVIARLKGFKFNAAFAIITVDGLAVPFTMIRDSAVNIL